MSENKGINTGTQKPRQNDGEKRGFSLPSTSSKPPMPPVQPPKKK